MPTPITTTAKTDPPADRTSESFGVRTVIEGDVLVVHVAGELRLDGRHLVTHSCLQEGRLFVRVDMAKLTLLDVDGFGGLLAAMRLLERCGGSMDLVRANGQPQLFLARAAKRTGDS